MRRPIFLRDIPGYTFGDDPEVDRNMVIAARLRLAAVVCMVLSACFAATPLLLTLFG